MIPENPKIVFFGAGVVGGSVAGWVAPHYDNLYVLDQGATAEAIRKNGITLYLGGRPEEKTNVRVKVIEDLGQAADADVIVLGVKNYSLGPVARMIKEAAGDRPVIVSMANGIENQKVLPEYFPRVIYCVVCYNGWLDGPGVIGFQKKGPLVIGTPDNGLPEEMKAVAGIFNRGVETIITSRVQDAIHCKIVINLANSATTLVGHQFREISDRAAFQKILTNLLYEGKEIIKAAGYRECKLGGMPPWATFWFGAKLPRFITWPIFDMNVKKLVVSSMAQDVLQRRGQDTELESINGHIVKLAGQAGMKAPVNRTIYEMSKREFAKPDFKPLDERDVWAEVRRAMMG